MYLWTQSLRCHKVTGSVRLPFTAVNVSDWSILLISALTSPFEDLNNKSFVPQPQARLFLKKKKQPQNKMFNN